MKNLLLTLCFVFITSLVFCQTPNQQNTQVHLKYFAQNCISVGSINDVKKVIGNGTEISPYKSLLHMATGYNRLPGYSIVCFIGQNTWHETAKVIKPWQFLDGSIRGLGFRTGYSIFIGVNGNSSLLEGQLSL